MKKMVGSMEIANKISTIALNTSISNIRYTFRDFLSGPFSTLVLDRETSPHTTRSSKLLLGVSQGLISSTLPFIIRIELAYAESQEGGVVTRLVNLHSCGFHPALLKNR